MTVSIERDGFVVTCPDCHGTRFQSGVICGLCRGEGGLFIPELREKSSAMLYTGLALLVFAIGALMVLIK